MLEEKILLLSDSACDLTLEDEKRLGVRILNIPLCVRGESLMDRADITIDEIYRELNSCTELPTTAHINAVEFGDAYLQAVEEGYNRIIYLGLNSKGSSTFNASLLGKKNFFAEHPQYGETVKIYNIDSLNYSYGYGYPLIMASQLVEEGRSAQEIVEMILDFMDHRGLYFSMYTLQFAKRSGRIGAAASFVGDMLGLRPIMSFPDGKNVMVDKVRGDKNVIPKLVELYKTKVDPEKKDYVIIYGENDALAEELKTMLEEAAGKPPVSMTKTGACVAINAGPQLIGLSFREKDGGKYREQVQ